MITSEHELTENKKFTALAFTVGQTSKGWNKNALGNSFPSIYYTLALKLYHHKGIATNKKNGANPVPDRVLTRYNQIQRDTAVKFT